MTILKKIILASLACSAAGAARADVAELQSDLDRRFVLRPQGLLLDYVNLDGAIDLPDAEDCRLGRPNALSWWTPLENGPFLTGLYLDAVLRRYASRPTPDDAKLARELVSGLLRCADLDDRAPGFIARGVYGPDLDAPAFYGIGSDDQTAPWFFGLWRYLASGIPDATESAAIVATMRETAEALRDSRWNMPCAPVGDLSPGLYRGGWAGADFRGATRLLFVARVMHVLTKDPEWLKLYDARLADTFKSGAFAGMSRLDVVAAGMAGEWKTHPDLRHHLWIYVVSQAMLDELARLETREEIRESYVQALQQNALAVTSGVVSSIPSEVIATKFRTDWRTMSSSWRPQRNPDEAVAVAMVQIREWANRGRELEIKWVREPACAAWIAFHAPRLTPEVETAAARFHAFLRDTEWDRLRASHGLFAEGAWRLLETLHPELAAKAAETGPVSPAPTPSPTQPVAIARAMDMQATRCANQFAFQSIPSELVGKTLHVIPRGDSKTPGASFTVRVAGGSTAWLLVMDKGEPVVPPGWEPTGLTVAWHSGSELFRDRVYRRTIPTDMDVIVPEAVTRDVRGIYAIPHALVVSK